MGQSNKVFYLIILLFLSYRNPTCEQATSLTGNIFVADYRIKYPEICLSTTCREGYKIKLINALRMGYRTVTIVMNFTNGEIRNVQLVFCALLSSSRLEIIKKRSNLDHCRKTKFFYFFTENFLLLVFLYSIYTYSIYKKVFPQWNRFIKKVSYYLREHIFVFRCRLYRCYYKYNRLYYDINKFCHKF